MKLFQYNIPIKVEKLGQTWENPKVKFNLRDRAEGQTTRDPDSNLNELGRASTDPA